jgi:tRNA isopentenyl-2-thiomethyl-A-37 hydroxylase MiaE
MTKREAVYTKHERFENELAHCYFLLHRRFIAEPALSRFWSDAAREELEHFSILRFCREHQAMTNIELDPNAVQDIEDVLETVKNVVTDSNVTVDEAFFAALLIESTEMDKIYGKLSSGLQKDHPVLYQAIQASLLTHYLDFEQGAEKFCKDRKFIDAFRKMGDAG